MIYLDTNASTPVDPRVAEAIYSSLSDAYGNPSSTHTIGIRARELVEGARIRVADVIGVRPEEVYFTSGGTESNNLAILGRARKERKGHIITSSIEHPSVINPCRHLERDGFDVTYVGVGADGRVAVEAVRRALRGDTILMTVMHANNETGVIQPIEEIGALARENGIAFHTDAAQTIGKIPVNAVALGADMMTIVPHKFYGPKGAGALFVRSGLSLLPILFGAGHERGLRPGTENVPGIVGLGKASELARAFAHEWASHMVRMRDLLLQGLKQRFPALKLNGHETLRLPNTLNVSIPELDATDALEAVRDRLAASAGSACHAGTRKPSSVLVAMGISDQDALSSLRLSVGKDTTESDIREAIAILASVPPARRP